jgi:Fic family protein
LWHTLILTRHHSLFQFVPIESVIRNRQLEYYKVLAACDRAGNSTSFIEFALAATHDALELTLSELAPKPVTGIDRLQTSREHFGRRSFSRKDYLELFPSLSTATASRDLKLGVDQFLLTKTGDKSQARYLFVLRIQPMRRHGDQQSHRE